MNAFDPDTDLAQRRKDFEDALIALGLDEPAKLALRAAASALAKAKTIATLATFVDVSTGERLR